MPALPRKAPGRVGISNELIVGATTMLLVCPAIWAAKAAKAVASRSSPCWSQTTPLADARLLSELVTVAFSQRRKLLRHTLGRWLDQKDFTGTFNTQRRAEEVPVSEFVELARTLGG